MKRQFGSFFSRLRWGGTTLSPLEFQLLQELVAALPLSLRGVVTAQFDAYNLVQRESDGRALNFYRKRSGIVREVTDLPLIEHKQREAPLVRLTATVGTNSDPLHAVLTAVDGRAFCVSLDRRPNAREHRATIQVERTVEAWRSNVLVRTRDA